LRLPERVVEASRGEKKMDVRRMGHVRERIRCRTHRKVFNGETFPQLSRWFWICPDCLETGSDKLQAPPELNAHTYWTAMRKLNPQCWVPARFRTQ